VPLLACPAVLIRAQWDRLVFEIRCQAIRCFPTPADTAGQASSGTQRDRPLTPRARLCIFIVVPKQSRKVEFRSRSREGPQVIGDKMDTLLSRITIDLAVCHGKPCVRGLRYPVEMLLELLSSGMTPDEILADYEDLEREDLLAVLAFAAG